MIPDVSVFFVFMGYHITQPATNADVLFISLSYTLKLYRNDCSNEWVSLLTIDQDIFSLKQSSAFYSNKINLFVRFSDQLYRIIQNLKWTFACFTQYLWIWLCDIKPVWLLSLMCSAIHAIHIWSSPIPLQTAHHSFNYKPSLPPETDKWQICVAMQQARTTLRYCDIMGITY